mgnify:CR=1 FL=1
MGKKIWLVRVSQPVVAMVILGFGALGLLLSLPGGQPAVVVAGGRIGFFLRMFLDMLEFALLGI